VVSSGGFDQLRLVNAVPIPQGIDAKELFALATRTMVLATDAAWVFLAEVSSFERRQGQGPTRLALDMLLKGSRDQLQQLEGLGGEGHGHGLQLRAGRREIWAGESVTRLKVVGTIEAVLRFIESTPEVRAVLAVRESVNAINDSYPSLPMRLVSMRESLASRLLGLQQQDKIFDMQRVRLRRQQASIQQEVVDLFLGFSKWRLQTNGSAPTDQMKREYDLAQARLIRATQDLKSADRFYQQYLERKQATESRVSALHQPW
jgi:hypothetical protein